MKNLFGKLVVPILSSLIALSNCKVNSPIQPVSPGEERNISSEENTCLCMPIHSIEEYMDKGYAGWITVPGIYESNSQECAVEMYIGRSSSPVIPN